MASRGRGRGRGFGRGKPFPSTDQLNPVPAEKVAVAQHASTYPILERKCAQVSLRENKKKETYYDDVFRSTPADQDDLFKIKEQLVTSFQTSNYYLSLDDKNSKLFSSQGEKVTSKKNLLNFHWESFPLELRPTSKRKQKSEEMLASLRKKQMVSVDLSWLDKLEEKETDGVADNVVPTDEVAKKEPLDNQEEEVEEFDDEELDLDTDYNTNYFDDGEGYMDDDNDLDEGPCF